MGNINEIGDKSLQKVNEVGGEEKTSKENGCSVEVLWGAGLEYPQATVT